MASRCHGDGLHASSEMVGLVVGYKRIFFKFIDPDERTMQVHVAAVKFTLDFLLTVIHI
jgi:hypothetical protein